MMKKFLALALAASMSMAVLAGCSAPASSTAGSTAASTAGSAAASTAGSTEGTTAASSLKVDVFYYDFSDVYISTVRAAMDEQLKAMGIEPKNWDAAGSQPTQTDQVNTAIADNSDLLIVNIVETSTSDPI